MINKNLVINHEIIKEELEIKGYFVLMEVLNKDYFQEMVLEIEKEMKKKPEINANELQGVYSNNQYFDRFMIAKSKKVYEFMTNINIRNIASYIFGKQIRLKSNRYYETYSGARQEWHRDVQINGVCVETRGLIFMYNLTDVSEGAFQVIESSHLIQENKLKYRFTDKEINEKYIDKIVSFRVPKGTIVIADSGIIHRGEPTNKNIIRKSLIFQIDASLDYGDQLILNSSYIDKIDESLTNYLGFGLSCGKIVSPKSTIVDLPIIIKTNLKLITWIPLRLAKEILRKMPTSYYRKIANLLGKS